MLNKLSEIVARINEVEPPNVLTATEFKNKITYQIKACNKGIKSIAGHNNV